MSKFNIYKLTNGKTQGKFQLPMSEVFIRKFVEEINKETGEKETVDLGYRNIRYVPGEKSIYAEDQNKDLKPQHIWFDNGVLSVLKGDKLKNEILQKHPWFNTHYILFDKQEEAKNKLKERRIKDEVTDLLRDSDTLKIKATATAIFGQVALTWDEFTAELELREYAEKNPLKIKSELNAKDYESKYLSALAFLKGIVTTDIGKTQIQWNDGTNGMIATLATGENEMSKLSTLLFEKTKESELILQTIGQRLSKLEMNLPKKEKDVAKTIKDKDAEIEALKKQLAEAQKGGVQSSTNGADDSELAELQAKYKEKFEGKEVPINKKNNKEWIAKKLAETTTE